MLPELGKTLPEMSRVRAHVLKSNFDPFQTLLLTTKLRLSLSWCHEQNPSKIIHQFAEVS